MMRDLSAVIIKRHGRPALKHAGRPSICVVAESKLFELLLLAVAVTAHELINAASRIDKFLLTGEERVR